MDLAELRKYQTIRQWQLAELSGVHQPRISNYEKGKVIRGISAAEELEGVKVFHAGTSHKDGELLTNGGRVLGVTAIGGSLAESQTLAYEAVGRISFEGAYWRRDIAAKALPRK